MTGRTTADQRRGVVIRATLAAFLVISLLSGCAAASSLAVSVCEIRNEYRDDYIAVRDAIATRLHTFDAETQLKLQRLNDGFVEFDKVAEIACAAERFDEKRALEIALKIASGVGELKARGVI